MSEAMLNLIKLVVGVSSLEDLAARQTQPENARSLPGHATPLPVVHTRAFPRRKDEILPGGSLYRVISGLILCRQEILAIETSTRADGTSGTLLFLNPTIIRVQACPMRPFQGWRYLSTQDSPPDLDSPNALHAAPPHGGPQAAEQTALPLPLLRELALLGL